MRTYPGIDPALDAGFKICAVNDIETTGLKVGEAEVITCAMLLCDYTKPDLPVVSGKLFRFRPRFPNVWDKGAEKVHGITLDEAMSFPPADQAALEMLEWMESHIGQGPAPFICHAMKPFKSWETYFDWGHVRQLYYDLGLDKKIEGGHFRFEKMFPQKTIMSTVHWAKVLTESGDLPLKNAKLDTLCDHFGIHLDHHNAVSDAKACRELFIKYRGGNYGKVER